MNIFYLDHDVINCVKQYPNKHVIKMILETAQILSTANRVLDGTQVIQINKNRKNKVFKLNDSRDNTFYKSTHINHPCNIWARSSSGNYEWLHNLLVALNDEYTYRYNKIHKVRCSGLELELKSHPFNIKNDVFSEPPLAMPDDVKCYNTIKSYQNYYNKYKTHLFDWKDRKTPNWVKT